LGKEHEYIYDRHMNLYLKLICEGVEFAAKLEL